MQLKTTRRTADTDRAGLWIEFEAKGSDTGAGSGLQQEAALQPPSDLIRFPSGSGDFQRQIGVSTATHNCKGPKLVVGLPVRNGENYLQSALDCLRAQTFGDYRLVIADNASTDSTPEICREYAARDPRITYIRHSENIGAARNFNFVFRAASSQYFKWAAHDDVMEPTFLERCVAALDADESLVLAHSYTNEIDALGHVTRPLDDQVALLADRPSERLAASFRIAYPCPVWGVMRRRAVERTRLFGSFLGSDWNFIGEMMLLGRIALVPEYLFSVRNHCTAYSFGLQHTPKAERLAWFNPRVKSPTLLSAVISTARFTEAALVHPLPMRERAACLRHTARRTALRFQSIVARRMQAGGAPATAGAAAAVGAVAPSAESGT